MQGGGSSSGSGDGAPFDVRAAALLLARFAANAHTVCDDELRPVGAGLYPLGALVNHGGPPSAMQGFSGAAIEFRRARGGVGGGKGPGRWAVTRGPSPAA
jgi:hypothetical protein